MRQLLAPPHGACGRGCAPVPKPVWGRGLFERSEFRSPNIRDWGKGTRRATHGRRWFWVLLPKQKDLAVRGRNPAFLPSARGAETPRIPLAVRGRNPASIPPLAVRGRNPASLPLAFCHSRKFLAGIQCRCAVVGAASHAACRGDKETDSAMGWRGCGRGGDRPTEGGMRCRHYRRGGGGETPHPESVSSRMKK